MKEVDFNDPENIKINQEMIESSAYMLSRILVCTKYREKLIKFAENDVINPTTSKDEMLKRFESLYEDLISLDKNFVKNQTDKNYLFNELKSFLDEKYNKGG
jgi:hypothetical protein